MNPWLETAGAVILALCGMALAHGLSKLPQRFWISAWLLSLGVVCIFGVERYTMGLEFVPPFSWVAAGRTRYILAAFTGPILILTPAAKLPRYRDRVFLRIFTGLFLRNQSVSGTKKALYLVSAGAAGAVLGWLWGLEMPVIKKIWTSSYVLVAGGYSAMLLGLFYWIVEVKEKTAWCQPFVWIGMNPITLYLASNFLGGLGFEKLAQRLAGGPVKSFFDAHVARGFGELVISAVAVALFVWFARFLYQRKIFLRF